MFVGPRTWLALLGFDHDWLRLNPSQWVSDQAFLDMAHVMTDLAVVNGTAERGIKDVEEYANASQDGEQGGKIILVSNSHRTKLPVFLNHLKIMPNFFWVIFSIFLHVKKKVRETQNLVQNETH